MLKKKIREKTTTFNYNSDNFNESTEIHSPVVEVLRDRIAPANSNQRGMNVCKQADELEDMFEIISQ